jgi:hypothetical protein
MARLATTPPIVYLTCYRVSNMSTLVEMYSSYRSQNEDKQSARESDRNHLDRVDLSYDCLTRLCGAHGLVATADQVVEHFSVHGGGRGRLSSGCVGGAE